MKAGNVAIVGRPNAGKSTLINAILGKKISIVSPKPQTTRRIINGYWWDDNTQIIFWDTPGIFTRVKDLVAQKSNRLPQQSLENADVILYLIDKTRGRGDEENRILGLVRQIKKPKILVINKIDIKEPDYTYEYKFLEDEFDDHIAISSQKKTNIKALMQKIISFLPEGDPLFDPKLVADFPANMTPKEFVADVVQEKIFLVLRQEVPYTAHVTVEQIDEKENVFYVKARIEVTDDRYKRMLIGAKGQTVKEIGTLSRKELELVTGKKVFLELEVVTDPHWPQYFLR